MPILRWIGVNPQASTSTQNPKSALEQLPDAKPDDASQGAPSADAKRFGLINVRPFYREQASKALSAANGISLTCGDIWGAR